MLLFEPAGSSGSREQLSYGVEFLVSHRVPRLLDTRLVLIQQPAQIVVEMVVDPE